MACRECHVAKVKCDKVLPCSRCVRLSKVCIRHESRQGQGRNKKRARSKVSEDATISTEVGTLKPNHYGLQYLVRSWVALALRRRNFGLLARAGMIADRSGISMDQIFCENGNQRGMDFLYSLLLTPAPNQQVLGNRLSWSEIPHGMLVATGCVGATDRLNDPIVADRWIWIREIRHGVSRYLVTPAFDRDIADWNLIQQTYRENDKSVVELFLNPTEIGKHTKAFAHQISLHATPDLAPRSSRMRSKVKLKNKKGGAQTAECDQVFCLAIENLDHDFTYQEYVPRIPIENPTPPQAAMPQMAGSNTAVAVGTNNNLGMGAAVMGVALGLQRQQQVILNGAAGMQQGIPAMNNNNNNPAGITNNNRISSAEVDADAAFKSGLDMGLPLLDLDNFDDDADLDFFLNVLK
jgi:Fungal Zn(2)-Cys(6) binuclear cluster domain